MSKNKSKKTVEMDVIGCSRCGCDHKKVLFKKFIKEPGQGYYSHWAMCPANNEPVLMAVVED